MYLKSPYDASQKYFHRVVDKWSQESWPVELRLELSIRTHRTHSYPIDDELLFAMFVCSKCPDHIKHVRTSAVDKCKIMHTRIALGLIP